MKPGELVRGAEPHYCDPPTEPRTLRIPNTYGATSPKKGRPPGPEFFTHTSQEPPPAGSKWRCPVCGAKWVVWGQERRNYPGARCYVFGSEWMQSSSGFLWRLFHRTSVYPRSNDD